MSGSIGGYTPDIDILDFNTLERWETALADYSGHCAALPPDLSSSAQVKYLLDGMNAFFDTVFGGGSASLIMDGSSSLASALARFAETKEFIEHEAASQLVRINELAARFLPRSK